jgi:hypothetical protein
MVVGLGINVEKSCTGSRGCRLSVICPCLNAAGCVGVDLIDMHTTTALLTAVTNATCACVGSHGTIGGVIELLGVACVATIIVFAAVCMDIPHTL